ncbi:hypothetical protein K8I85_10740 [bacterium]|nr:hypothetical protein [bacterium]
MMHGPGGRLRAGWGRCVLRAFAGAAAIACLSAGSCEDSTQNPDPGLEPIRVADFSRHDVNDTSPTFDTDVSPRDYLQSISAWYFGHAT